MEGKGNNLTFLAAPKGVALQNEIPPPSIKSSLKSKDGHVFVPPKPVENIAHKQEKYVSKTTDFNLLVAKVGEKDFVQILKHIFNFLTSNNDEEEFRNISKDMEEILVLIVKDVDVLKSENICGKIYCEKIIEILNHAYDSRIFKLVCFFKKEAQEILLQGLGVQGKNILVYKKLYQSGNFHERLPSMSSLLSSPPISRSASTNSLTSERSSLYITPPSKDQFIPHCFQLIINFVKDTTQQSLEFSGLSAEDAKFLHSSFSSIIAGDARGKNVCVDLWETVKASRFEFRITYIKAQSLDTKSLLLEKQYRMTDSSSTDTVSDYSSSLPVPMKAKQKKKAIKYGKFVNNLNSDFITRSLERIVYFLSDDAQGSLQSLYSNEHEMKFLRNIVNLGRSDSIQTVFDAQHRKLFSEMCRLLDSINFKMRTTVNKRKGRPNEILYIKVPRFEGSQQKPFEGSQQKPFEGSQQNRGRSCERPACLKPIRFEDPYHQMGRPWYPKTVTAPKQAMSSFVPKIAMYTNTWQQAENLSASNYGASRSQSAMVPTLTPIQGMTKAKVSNIDFQPGGLMTQMTCEKDPVLVEAMQKHDTPENILAVQKPMESKQISQPQAKQSRSRSKEAKPKKGDRQLINALSVPVRSDKALKMMMGMGWTGGALGTRGDGITEPIMPHLRNGTGAGLGHAKGTQIAPKPTKEPAKATPKVPQNVIVKRSNVEFRKIFLGSILKLLNSSDKSKTLDFNSALQKKDRGFVRHAINTFAARTKLALTEEEKKMVHNIEQHYANDLELTVTACISNDLKRIVLEKKHGLSKDEKLKLKELENLTLDKNPTISMNQIMDQLGPICQSEHALESSKFRVRILLELLNFVKDKNEKEIKVLLQKKLKPKQKNFLELVLSGVNKRSRFGATAPEVALSTEIKKYIGLYALGIKFSEDFKSITLTKDYDKSQVCQAANLDSTGDDIDYLSSDNDDDVTAKDKSDDKIIKQEINSQIDDATENNDQKKEVKNGNDKEINKNDDLRPQAVNEPDLNIAGLVKAIKKENVDKEIKKEENIPDSEISMIYDTIGNSCDDISISENSGFTENLDYNETDDNDINMSDDAFNSDKQLNETIDLSNLSTSTLNVENATKIKDISCVIVYLSKECDVSIDMPKYVQGLISHNIMEIKEKEDLPLLKCHGLHDNFLIYSCHTKKTYDWLQYICVANKITICTKEFDKMSLKVKTFFDFDEKYIFYLLEMYNEEISTKDWSVLKKKSLGHSVILDVKMDKTSVRSVLESNLELYAGVDKVKFSVIWD